MAKSVLLSILKILMILIFAGWVTLWLLKPTNLWTKKWKQAEDCARATIFGYYGLNFAAFTFPIIALAIIGLVYLNFLAKESTRRREARNSTIGLSNPVIVNSFLGILSSKEIITIFIFIMFLVWTFYSRISNDMKKLMPIKSLNMNLWQLKYLRVATRFGLLAEACLVLLLLPILRGLSIFKVLGIQFEASVRYHIWLGTSMIFFATIHGGSTLFLWGVSHNIQDEMWRWQKTGRIYLAGEIALVIGLVIWITSLPQIRRKRFEIFFYTHHLYAVFFVFFLFHAGDRHFYAVFPGIFLFGIDKLLRIIQSRPKTCILSAKIFPNKAVQLVLPKDPSLKYTPTSVLYVKIPIISKFQWHSFSIISSSEDDHNTMSMIIKCEGRWTSCIHDIVKAELDSNAEHMRCIPIAIEGPYGPSSLDFLRHDSLLLIAGGSGITPFLSILKEIACAKSSRFGFPSEVELIYVVKKSQDICLLNPISGLLMNRSSSKQLKLKIRVFVTQEQRSASTLREILNDIYLIRTVNFSTKSSNYAVHGLESPLKMATLAASACIVFLVFLICLNQIFIPSKKKGSFTSKKMVVGTQKEESKEKTSSTVVDLLLFCSFIIAVTCSGLMAMFLRWKRVKKEKEIPSVSNKQSKNSLEITSGVEEHEINFGGRPNFQDVLTKFVNESGGSEDIGVLVCGPETMKESVASICKLKSQGLNVGAKGKKRFFSFHSLNFTL